MVSDQESRGGVQLQGGFLLGWFPSAALLVLFRSVLVFFGLLIQQRTSHFALNAARIKRGDCFAALRTQQRLLNKRSSWVELSWLLGSTDKALFLSLCGSGKYNKSRKRRL